MFSGRGVNAFHFSLLFILLLLSFFCLAALQLLELSLQHFDLVLQQLLLLFFSSAEPLPLATSFSCLVSLVICEVRRLICDARSLPAELLLPLLWVCTDGVDV